MLTKTIVATITFIIDNGSYDTTSHNSFHYSNAIALLIPGESTETYVSYHLKYIKVNK